MSVHSSVRLSVRSSKEISKYFQLFMKPCLTDRHNKLKNFHYQILTYRVEHDKPQGDAYSSIDHCEDFPSGRLGCGMSIT